MDRRSFLVRTGALFGVLQLSPFARADEKASKKTSKPKKKKEVKKPQAPPLPFVPGSWTIVVLPDIQHYATRYPGMLYLQTQWIADHIKDQNIKYVLQLGDLTNRNKRFEWERVDRAFKKIDHKVPYAVVPGNHDYVKCAHGERESNINDYFSPERFKNWPTFGGVMEPGHIENNYHLFEAGGSKWLVIGLEFGPRDKVLQWADTILSKYPDRKAIVFTHAYLYHDSTRYDWAAKGQKQRNNPHKFGTAGGVNDGEEMWQKLIRKHPNMRLVLNGHVSHKDGLGFQVSKGDAGNIVNEMLTDYQQRDLGGTSWLRLLEFLPDGKTVQARTYNPFYEKYETDPQSQFTFTIE